MQRTNHKKDGTKGTAPANTIKNDTGLNSKTIESIPQAETHA
jgi:hypothetical protein